VTLGIVNGDSAEVLDPSISGWVITMGQHLLEDGTTIILPDSRPSKDQGKGPKGK